MLEILIAHPVLAEMGDQLPKFAIANRLITDQPREINLFQHAGQHRIVLGNGAQSLVELITDVDVGRFVKGTESRRGRDEKPVIEVMILVGQSLRLLLAGTGGHFLVDNPFPFFLEHVRAALEKQHAEDEILVLRCVHLAAQNVGGGVEVALEFGQGQSGHEVASLVAFSVSFYSTRMNAR